MSAPYPPGGPRPSHQRGPRDPGQPPDPGQPRNPGQPVGPTHLDDFRPPRRRVPWVVVVVVVALVAGLAWAAVKVGRTPEAAAPPTYSPSATAGPTSTASHPAAPSNPAAASTPAAGATTGGRESNEFSTKDGSTTGTWRIDAVTWTAQGVDVTVTVSVRSGNLTDATFYLMENSSASMHEAEPNQRADDLARFQVGAGHSITGRVFIACPRGESTLILAGRGGREAISGLVVPG